VRGWVAARVVARAAAVSEFLREAPGQNWFAQSQTLYKILYVLYIEIYRIYIEYMWCSAHSKPVQPVSAYGFYERFPFPVSINEFHESFLTPSSIY